MNEASHIILLLWLVLAAIFAARMIEVMAPQFMRWYRRVSHPEAKSLAGFAGLVALAEFVVSKDFQGGPSSPDALNGGVLESAEMQSGSSSPALTEAQCRAGLALVAATNVLWDFAAPTNAVFCDLGSGVHDEAYWIPVSFNPEGTATNSRWGRAVCAAPSGMVLLDDVPDRLTPSLPDFSGAATNRVLSVLQTPSGLLPPLGKLWHAPTTNDSFLITWNHVFLGRDTNAVADLQLELFESGDFIYRLRLDENADVSAVTNWLIAAQDNGAGEVFAFSDTVSVALHETNSVPLLAPDGADDSILDNSVFAPLADGVPLRSLALELRWTSFLPRDPDDPDPDGDGLSDWEELFVHGTNPDTADTDGDGLWDGEEPTLGCNPLNPDSDEDGEPDFWQVHTAAAITNAPVPWAEEDGTNVLFIFLSRLLDTDAPAHFAVLRIGDQLAPVRQGPSQSARIALAPGAEAPFTLIPGPGLPPSALAELAVVAFSHPPGGGMIGYIGDPGGVFDCSAITEAAAPPPGGFFAPLAAGGAGVVAPNFQQGVVGNVVNRVSPDVICPHASPNGRCPVSFSLSGKKQSSFEIVLKKQGVAGTNFVVTASDFETPLPDTPGFHLVPIRHALRPRDGDAYSYVGEDAFLLAHHCVPITPDYQPEGWSDSDPYAVPMPTRPDNGEPCGTETRPHRTLVAGEACAVEVDLDGSGAGWRRCPLCGCGDGAAVNPGLPAGVYRATSGIEVTPQSLPFSGAFNVRGVSPSSDYGGDVFTYTNAGWFSRGRYTVLGLSNYLAQAGGSVSEAHVAAGVTNPLVLWTGVKLPSGTLELSLDGGGEASLIVRNRQTGQWETLLSPGSTNYASSITHWRDVYCHPSTLRAEASLVALAKGVATLTQAFEGSGNDLYVSHSVSQAFRVHTFVAEPITSETDASGHVYNPSGIPVGGTAKFKVSLDPMTGFSEDDIVWEAAEVSFVNGDNTGSEVTVEGGAAGGFLLAVQVNGLLLVPVPHFMGNVITPTTVPLTVWIVRDNYGQAPPISTNDISPLIAGANRILRQRALTLQWNDNVHYADRTEWQNISDVMNPTNALLDAMMDSSQNTGGLEIYFVKTLDGGQDTRGVNTDRGLALTQTATSRTLAHEVLHQCGLVDVYGSFSTETPLVVSGSPTRDRLPYDWGDGWYPNNLTQADIIERLAMNGLTDSGAGGRDLPSGPVYGLGFAFDSQSGTNTWFLGLRGVGQNSISSQTPAHQ